jgi:hypothetical protein
LCSITENIQIKISDERKYIQYTCIIRVLTYLTFIHFKILKSYIAELYKHISGHSSVTVHLRDECLEKRNVEISIKLVYIICMLQYFHKTHWLRGKSPYKNIKYAPSKALSKRHLTMQLISSCKVHVYKPI